MMVHDPAARAFAWIAAAWLCVTVFASVARAQEPGEKDPAPPEAPAEAPDRDAAAKEQARAHFDRGVELTKQSAWAAALAEFLRSRQIFPTKSATSNAIVCLRQLGRHDEALELSEALLREFSDLTPAVKAQTQRQIVELAALVGTIEVHGSELGASIVIDGRERGEFPSLAPLRVTAGTHVVRVYKEGYVPFETRVDVAGGQTERVAARLRALATFGRLEVVESGDRALDVVVDGIVVGKTPWRGPVEPGEHTVLLRGDGALGTQPVSVRVRANANTPLRVTAEELHAWLRVEPKPAGASVAIDSVTVGRGVWEGSLRAGPHTIEVAADGFAATSKAVRLERGQREVVSVQLARDPRSPFWRAPKGPDRWVIEASASVPIAPTLGGDVASACGDSCAHGVGLGVLAVVRGAYKPVPSVALGLMAGYLLLGQTSTGRGASLSPVGAGEDPTISDNQGSTEDRVGIERGILGGVWGGVTFGTKVPVRLGLATGLLLANVGNTRRGRFATSEGRPYEMPAVTVREEVAFVHVSPGVSVGYEIAEHVELALGVDAFVLVALSQPVWDEALLVPAASDGLGTFPRETIIGRAIFALSPGVSARYGF